MLENGISNEMANYMTMIFDPMAPSIRAPIQYRLSFWSKCLASFNGFWRHA